MSATRSLYIVDKIIGGWPGVASYRYSPGSGTVTLVPGYPYTGLPYNFLEVSVVTGKDRGSYWMPVAAEDEVPSAWPNPTYGGVENLRATGAIATEVGTRPIMRPSALLWWIPGPTLDAVPYTPASSEGQVTGQFPTKPPPDDPPPATETPLLYGPESLLSTLVTPYLFNESTGAVTKVTGYPFSTAGITWYQMSAPATGVWLLASAPQASAPSSWLSDQYGGMELLEATGTGIVTNVGGSPVVRPSQLFFWSPQTSLAGAPFQLGTVPGGVKGRYPISAPPA